MVRLEATGAPIACGRCGQPASPREEDRADWASLFHNGRLVMLACPACQTPEERAEISQCRGSTLTEVAGGRRADTATLRRLARRSATTPLPGPWLDALRPRARHVGVLTGRTEGESVQVMWVGRRRDGEARAALLMVPVSDWMALEEVFVPYELQRWAAEQADNAG